MLFWNFENFDIFECFRFDHQSDFAPKQLIILQSQIKTLKQFKCLKRLCIHRSKFTRNIYELPNLEMLTLNNILGEEGKTISEKMRTLKNLRYLNVAENDFEILPEWICELPLKTLIIKNNRLKELTSNLPLTLVTLDFSSNYINRLPLSLSLLENLEYVNWERNPIQFPPKAILSNGMKSTMNYLQHFLTDTLPNDTVKLIFVGTKRSGKTTLMHALKSSNGKISNPKIIT